jgi:hypothetical protein
MLTSVGERLLDDPIGGHFESRREELCLSFDHEIDGQFCSAGLGDETIQLGEARLRSEFVDVTGAP